MLSIIVPVLNEAATIEKLLTHLVDNIKRKSAVEIIISDGGSTDSTREEVLAFAKENNMIPLHLITSKMGRAKQMNAGANVAKGDILYFLHADSFPPKDFDELIQDEAEQGNSAGCFKMRFDNNHWWLRLAGWLTKFNWRACRGGDQSQFITKRLFSEIGGYDEDYTIYEDNILLNELYARKQFIVIPKWLTSSARLYEEKGIWYLQYHFWAIYFKKWMGADANELHAYYRKHIKSANNVTTSTKPNALVDK